MKPEVIKFLNKCSIVFDTVEQLNGMEIPREPLLSDNRYKKIKDEIESIKTFGLSSSSLTSFNLAIYFTGSE